MLVKTKVIKRNGEEVGFDLEKIENAIRAANEEVDNIYKLNEFQVRAIADDIAGQVKKSTHAIHVEDIQDMVETGIMGMRGYEVAQKYVRYRYKRELARKSNTTDNGIPALIDNINEEVNQENSNKNPVINSTQRDYMAGEVSKDLSKRVLLPEEVVEAHEQGIIEFARKFKVPYRTYTPEALREIEGDFSSSAFVNEQIGVDNVCERSACAASGGGRKLAGKTAENGITVAVYKMV